MERKTMSTELFAEWAAGLAHLIAATAKAVGLKAVLGVVGACFLFLASPPERPDGTFSRQEFVARLMASGLFCVCFGDWIVDMMGAAAPWLQHNTHRNALLIATAAPGWYVSRWCALWLYRRKDKDAAEVTRDAAEAAKGLRS